VEVESGRMMMVENKKQKNVNLGFANYRLVKEKIMSKSLIDFKFLSDFY